MACEEGGYVVPNLVDGEFWLPSDFLSDEVMPLPKNSGVENGRLPYEWGLGLGSVGFQVDSPAGSPPAGLSETDEEDDYMAGLAERVAYAMLDDDENCQQGVDVGVGVQAAMNWASSEGRVFVNHSNAKCQMSRSPQSTLSGGLGRSRCSSTDGSRVQSNCSAGDEAWELFHMAADQVVRLNMMVPESSDRYKAPVKGFTVAPGGGEPQFQWNQNATDFQNGNSAFTGFDSGYNASHPGQHRSWNPRPRVEDRKITHQYAQTKQSIARQSRLQAIQTQQAQNRCGHAKQASRIYSACPPGQQVAGGSGMRAVFLGTNGPGRESGGTGVFLPRRMDNGHAVKQKPACSTVLLPARIVQALNLNVEDLRSKPCGLSETSLNRRVYTRAAEHQKALGGEMWPVHEQKLGFYPGCSEVQPSSADISLPHEWTY